MRIKDIKTMTEFYEFADIWYQRTHKLREVWQKKDETSERKAKAFFLWLIMAKRVLKLTSIATELERKFVPKFKCGSADNIKLKQIKH